MLTRFLTCAYGALFMAATSQVKGGTELNALGSHLLVELRDCDTDILGDLKKVENAMVRAAKNAKATIVDVSLHESGNYLFISL